MVCLKNVIKYGVLLAFGCYVLLIPYVHPSALMPEELSEDHESIECHRCHEAWNGAPASKCLDCHNASETHTHNGSQISGNCTSCHTLHDPVIYRQGTDCSICHSDVHGDQGLIGKECLDCHNDEDLTDIDYRHDASAMRELSRKDDHESKKKGCSLCHEELRFDEYNCLGKGCHGTSKEDKKHKEKAEDWKTSDCLASKCHGKR